MLLLVTMVVGVGVFATARSVSIGVQRDGSIVVPNGQLLTPAGTHIEVNDRPLGMVLSPNGRTLAVVTGSNFNPRALHLIDVDTQKLKQTVSIANSFVGVAFNPAGNRLFVGGGASNDVKLFAAAPDGTFAAAGSIPIAGAAPSGLALSADGSLLYVALNMTHQVAVINMFRTIQQILGLPPQNQYAASAEPMFTLFTSKPDFRPYTALPNQIPLNEMNPALAGLTGLQRQLAEFSLTINSSEPDSAPAEMLNRAIWHSVKGFGTAYNYGRPIRRQTLSSFFQLAGF